MEKGIAFVSRTSKNNGVSAIVEEVQGVEPFQAGQITVALSSMSVLETNLQPYDFYTGFHVMVLSPKREMTINEKLYYCVCIKKNKYKYYFGRQANRTLGGLEVPDIIPKWVFEKDMDSFENISLQFHESELKSLYDTEWDVYLVEDLFNVVTGKGPLIRNTRGNKGNTPHVSSSQFKNGIVAYTNFDATHRGNPLILAKNGSVGETFYQVDDFTGTSDILVLEPRFEMNVYTAMFLIPIIKKDRHKYNYGRKWNKEQLDITEIKLRSLDGRPNWALTEKYIKSLRFLKYMNPSE